jgi:hypothetical protein
LVILILRLTKYPELFFISILVTKQVKGLAPELVLFPPLSRTNYDKRVNPTQAQHKNSLATPQTQAVKGVNPLANFIF